MKQNVKGTMLVYTVGMTEAHRAWFESNLRGLQADARHFDTIEEFSAALLEVRPGMVVVADPPSTEEEIHRVLDARPETANIPVFRAPGRSAELDHDNVGPRGSAPAVMTGFDAMQPIDDAEPWRKRPI